MGLSDQTRNVWTLSGLLAIPEPPTAMVAASGIPLAAELTLANTGDNEPAPRVLDEVPLGARFVLDDTHDNNPAGRDHCFGTDRFLVA